MSHSKPKRSARMRARAVGGRRRTRRLGLDLGGVLIRPFLPGTAKRVARRTGRDRAEVRALLGRDFRMPYFAGRLPEDAIWDRLEIAPKAGRRLLRLDPLPAMGRLPEWAAMADIWIVSNHRHEWVDPVLAAEGVTDLAARILISSRTGLVKPDHAALEPLIADGTDPEDVLFVDDQARNVEAARDMGMRAVLADDDGDWTLAVDAWLLGEAHEDHDEED
ncbi:MAG: HAD-IA family hydrolase [Thermoleophilia bacterium]|nr:HAD-IA family hydrolase [Thermoleophilia bacterium]